MIPVVLITGFLGSGKTTLLKEIASQHRHRRIVYLVNDFASVDVDGELVRQADRQVVAISGGSIFCHCLVTEFIGHLKSIAGGKIGDGTRPEGVIIEASGMADPRVIDRMLAETKLNEHFEIHRIAALIDPGTFHKLLKTLPTILAQVRAADTLLISKADLHDTTTLAETEAAALVLRPEASCFTLSMGRIDLDWFEQRHTPVVEGELAKCVDPNFHRFIWTTGLPDVQTWRHWVELAGPGLYRSKGFLRDDAGLVQVDYSSSGIRVEPWDDPSVEPRLVCIASGEDGPALEARWRSAGPSNNV